VTGAETKNRHSFGMAVFLLATFASADAGDEPPMTVMM
jgi:hypothetical protein